MEYKKVKYCWMVFVGNHPCYGEGLKILPHANNNRKKIWYNHSHNT